MTDEPLLQLKRDLRVDMIARRAAIADDVRAQARAALVRIWRRERPVPAREGIGTVPAISAFWPMGEEIDIRPLLQALHDDGHALSLPRTPRRGEPLTFHAWRPGDPLERGPVGTSQPPAAAPVIEPDALIVPLLAVDPAGFRLGYGGGYFDRTLAHLRARRAITAIGVAFEVQRVARVPTGPNDARLDFLLTERALLAFA
ncbi:MAG: 5-formyltetrahydrofolate cyclo-ligase [Alphaproteobacteria bacterium]|nr:5-formyltetrahydrofolate cyclo-ligase [Alphaproteobacteria bacterium]MCW5743173.1 5-formyltetrahydrofolate cyclo-ligase [Alphaproteobacteria bacterium]